MLASSGFLGHVKLIPTAPCCLRARYLQQLPRIKQNVVCTQSTKARKVQKQQAPPQHGLPFEGRQKALPPSPKPDEQAAKDVTASDRTLSVIIRVSTCLVHCKTAPCLSSYQGQSYQGHNTKTQVFLCQWELITLLRMPCTTLPGLPHCQSPHEPLSESTSPYTLQSIYPAFLPQHCLQQQLCLACRTVVVLCQKRCHLPNKG